MSLVPPKGERYLSFRHQQTRAARLAEEHVRVGTTFLVVGAGAAGLTFAATILRLGGDAVVIEKLGSPLWNLRGCFTRYLHPNLFQWPLPACDQDVTEVPAFNWIADYAHQVHSQFTWSTPIDLPIHLGVDAQPVRAAPPRWRLTRDIWHRGVRVGGLQPSGSIELVFASGPGLEVRGPHASNSSYWLDDDLERQDPYQGHRHVIIAGNGDGAITDLLRTRIDLSQSEVLARTTSNVSLARKMSTLLTLQDQNGSWDPSALPRLKELALQYTLDLPFRSQTRVTWIARQPLGKLWPLHAFLGAYMLVHDSATRLEEGRAHDREVLQLPLNGNVGAPAGERSASRAAVSILVADKIGQSSTMVTGDTFVLRAGTSDPAPLAKSFKDDPAGDVPSTKARMLRVELPEPLGRHVNVEAHTTAPDQPPRLSDLAWLRAHFAYFEFDKLPRSSGYRHFPLALLKIGTDYRFYSHGDPIVTSAMQKSLGSPLPWTLEVVSRNRHRKGRARTMGVLRLAICSTAPGEPLATEWMRRGVECIIYVSPGAASPDPRFEIVELHAQVVQPALSALHPARFRFFGDGFRLRQKDCFDLADYEAATLQEIAESGATDSAAEEELVGVAEFEDARRLDAADVVSRVVGARLLFVGGETLERSWADDLLRRSESTVELAPDTSAYLSAMRASAIDELDPAAWAAISGPLEELARLHELVSGMASGLRLVVKPAVSSALGAAQVFQVGGGANVEEVVYWAGRHRHAIAAAIEARRGDVFRLCETPSRRLLDLERHLAMFDVLSDDPFLNSYVRPHAEIARFIVASDPKTLPEVTDHHHYYRWWIVQNRWSTELLWADMWLRTPLVEADS